MSDGNRLNYITQEEYQELCNTVSQGFNVIAEGFAQTRRHLLALDSRVKALEILLKVKSTVDANTDPFGPLG